MRKLFCLLLVIVLVVSVALNIGMYRHISSESVVGDTVLTSDTVYVEKKDAAPVVRDEKVTGSVAMPCGQTTGHSNRACIIPCGQTGHSNRACVQPKETESDGQDGIVLPVIQRKYSDDSTYTAYVSGAKVEDYPRLDSIRVRQKTVTNTVTVTKTIRQKRRHWNIGLQAGYGYGFVSKQMEPYVGVGLTIGL